MLCQSITAVTRLLPQQRAIFTKFSIHVPAKLSRVHSEQSAIYIKSLSTLLQERKDTLRDRFDSLHQGIFSYGMDPVEFKLHCFTFFKYGYWQTHPSIQEKLISFLNHCDTREKVLKQRQNEANKEEAKSELQMILRYRGMFAAQLLPNTISDYELSNVYILQLSSYLRQSPKLRDIEFTFITLNFERILFRTSNFKQFVNEKDNAWIINEAASLFLDHCVSQIERLPVTLKATLISVARGLHVKHLPFLEWLKKALQKEKKEMNLQIFLSSLVYLGHHNSFPFQFFYRNKDSLMSFIEAAQKNSEKKVTVSMYMLEIFSRQRLPYCEQILYRLLICLRENLAAADVSQLARIFYYYSRLKCSIDNQFVTAIIQRIYLFLNVLEKPDYMLIIKAAASLNYRDEVLLEKLKEYDYELFLSSLKFGCESLGSFYKEVLDEVEASFKNDKSRYYRQDDEVFSEVVSIRPTA